MLDVTPIQIYDHLLSMGFTDPAVFVLGDRHIAGIWIGPDELRVMSRLPSHRIVLRSENWAVFTLTEALSWPMLLERIQRDVSPVASVTSFSL